MLWINVLSSVVTQAESIVAMEKYAASHQLNSAAKFRTMRSQYSWTPPSGRVATERSVNHENKQKPSQLVTASRYRLVRNGESPQSSSATAGAKSTKRIGEAVSGASVPKRALVEPVSSTGSVTSRATAAENLVKKPAVKSPIVKAAVQLKPPPRTAVSSAATSAVVRVTKSGASDATAANAAKPVNVAPEDTAQLVSQVAASKPSQKSSISRQISTGQSPRKAAAILKKSRFSLVRRRETGRRTSVAKATEQAVQNAKLAASLRNERDRRFERRGVYKLVKRRRLNSQPSLSAQLNR